NAAGWPPGLFGWPDPRAWAERGDPARTLRLVRDDRHRDIGVVHDLAGDRAQQQPAEPADAAAADDDLVSVLGRLDELLGGLAEQGLHRHVLRGVVTQGPGRVGHGFLRGLLGLVPQVVVGTVDLAAAPATGDDDLNGDHGQRYVTCSRRPHGPV